MASRSRLTHGVVTPSMKAGYTPPRVINACSKQNKNTDKQIFIPTGGGLGDVIRIYFRDEEYWGYLNNVKEKFPRRTIKVLSSCHNPQVKEFFRYHPSIDEFHEFGWIINGTELIEKYKGHATHIKETVKKYKSSLRWEQPTLYLGQEDHAEIDKITEGSNGIIVMHPFALRQAMTIEEFNHMANRLIDEFGYTVIYLGGTTDRFYNVNLENSPRLGNLITEECDYERSGLRNLINKSNCRVAYRLIELCDGFIGHGSCFNVFAWLREKRNVIFSRHHERELLTTSRTYGWPIIDNLPWCRNYYNDEWETTRKVADETIEFFRR